MPQIVSEVFGGTMKTPTELTLEQRKDFVIGQLEKFTDVYETVGNRYFYVYADLHFIVKMEDMEIITEYLKKEVEQYKTNFDEPVEFYNENTYILGIDHSVVRVKIMVHYK